MAAAAPALSGHRGEETGGQEDAAEQHDHEGYEEARVSAVAVAVAVA